MRRMGAATLFEMTVQITRMATHSTGNAPYIEKAVQDTKVKVNAKGAAESVYTRFTCVYTIGRNAPLLSPKRVLRFDHPFLFAIWQSRSTLALSKSYRGHKCEK